MDTNYKVALSLVLAVVVAGAIYGAYLYPKALPPLAGAAPAGSTDFTPTWAAVAGVNLATPGTLGAIGGNGTSSSVLNSSTNDYYISTIKVGCEGVGASNTAYSGGGLAALTLSVATSSTPGPASNGNASVVGGGTLTIGTSTSQFGMSSSTLPAAGNPKGYLIWGAGTYLTFTTNATNTAVCTFGADYFSS